jgi:hypothetical protein|eukprot:COSAG06_NODE_4951_length_3838_cov_118.881456_6_plen_30_part_00
MIQDVGLIISVAGAVLFLFGLVTTIIQII